MQTTKEKLIDLNFAELQDLVESLGEKKFRAAQLYKWLNAGVPYSGMSNLSKSFRETLQAKYTEGYAELVNRQVAKDDTVKYLFGLNDGVTVESVLMAQSYGNTLCISTQAGCRMGCKFCASGAYGLSRQLSAGEILAQVLGAKQDGQAVNNIVLMGMGEPFDNYDNVVKFLRLVNADEGINLGWRSISLSTCGVVPQIIAFAKEKMPVTLAISLHAPNDDVRKKIMPISSAYTIYETIDAAKYYFNKTGRRVIIEYVLLNGINCEISHAEELAKLLRGLNCHVNLIPYNTTDGMFDKPSKQQIDAFKRALEKNKIGATLRKTHGEDIDGACGQLRLKHLDK